MKTLDQFIKKSEKLRKANAAFVKITAYKAGRNKQGLATAIAKTYTPLSLNIHNKLGPASDRKKRYITKFTFIDKKLHVHASCSCPDYLYRWEYANAQDNAGEIIYGNGEAPGATNPAEKPGLCKHLIGLRTFIAEKHGI